MRYQLVPKPQTVVVCTVVELQILGMILVDARETNDLGDEQLRSKGIFVQGGVYRHDVHGEG